MHVAFDITTVLTDIVITKVVELMAQIKLQQ